MEIVLHLGAHKTASTYLQSLLETNIVPLERHCVGFANPKKLRPMFALAPRRNFSTPRAARNEARAWALRQVIDTAHDLQRKRLIISEEQLIGSLRPLFSGKGLYRDIARELRGVVTALQGQPVKVMMALRSYDTFLTSAYGQVLTGWKYIRFTQELREHLLRENRGWPEIVTEIMQVLPKGSTLSLWEYEHFGQEEPNVLRNLVGDAAAEELGPLNTKPRVGPSGDGIAALDKKAASGGAPDVEEIRRTLREFGKDKGFPGYCPWSASEKAMFEDRYKRDIELIRCLWPEALLSGYEPPCAIPNNPNGQDRLFQRPTRRPITNLQKQITYRRPIIDTF